MTIETALVIIPPKDVQAFAFPLREEYAPLSFHQMPAHLTLLYPFVSEAEIDAALQSLNQVCSTIAPFHLTLDQYDRLDTVVYLTTSDPAQLIELQSRLAQTFPAHPLYAGAFGETFIPHLTLAEFEVKAEADQIQLPPVPDFSFEVKNIHLYLGEKQAEAPFIPRAVIPLGGTS